MQITIKCPKCGWEYLPAEIYYPDDLLGKPINITHDEEGKIDFFEGNNMNLKEDFYCTECGCHFEIDGNIKFKTTIIDDNCDFNEEYVVKL